MTGDELHRLIERQAALAELEDLLAPYIGNMALAATCAKLMRHGSTPEDLTIHLGLPPNAAKQCYDALRFLTESQFELLCSVTGGLYNQ